MSRGFPSMTALLGLLAVAGYQNRDKLAELLGGGGGAAPSPRGPGQMPQQGGLGGSLGGAGVREALASAAFWAVRAAPASAAFWAAASAS